MVLVVGRLIPLFILIRYMMEREKVVAREENSPLRSPSQNAYLQTGPTKERT